MSAIAKTTQDNYRQLVHTPPEIADEYLRHLEFRQKMIREGRGVTWGVKSVDAKIIPMIPGDLIGIIARPGHGKSTLAAYLAKRKAREIVTAKEAEKCVVYVSTEQPVEEVENYFYAENGTYTVSDLAWGRFDIEDIRRDMMRRIELPMLTIGRSLCRRKRNLPDLTMETIYRAIASIESEFGLTPALVVIDYIQKISLSRYKDRTQQVTEAVMGAKPLAGDIGAPIVMCVQASREVDSYKAKIPHPSDCQHASAIEQESDKLFGIWRPWLTETEYRDQTRSFNGKDLKITPYLFIMKTLKQRWDDAGHVFNLHFDPAAVKLADQELNYQ